MSRCRRIAHPIRSALDSDPCSIVQSLFPARAKEWGRQVCRYSRSSFAGEPNFLKPGLCLTILVIRCSPPFFEGQASIQSRSHAFTSTDTTPIQLNLGYTDVHTPPLGSPTYPLTSPSIAAMLTQSTSSTGRPSNSRHNVDKSLERSP